MYNEERNEKNYFFRNLIVKILLVLLFIFLLMWLFPIPNLSPFYDKIFTQNINDMTDAAKSYFTVERLPKNEDETKKLTLKEMIDNKMIIEFTDSDGKKCDTTKSYVEVTKKNGEYIYKTNLSCSKQEDYVIEYFGCYDVCKDNSCEVDNKPDDNKTSNETKKITEYQFYKVAATKYIDKYLCKEGYTLSGNKCIKTSQIKSEVDANIKCLDGYTYNSTSKKCEKIVSESEDAKLQCPSGYVYASSMNKCIKGTSNTVDATLTYKCTTGTLVGTKCVINATSEVDATKVYSCKNGTLSGTKCLINTTSEVDATKVYSCKNGTLSGTKCIVSGSYETDASRHYYCNVGTLSGTKCVYEEKVEVPEECSYTRWVCSNKEYDRPKSNSSTKTFTRRLLDIKGTVYTYEECNRQYKCTGGGTTTETKEVSAEVEYRCTTGTLSGTKCLVSSSDEVNADVTYKCTTGTLRGTKCVLDKNSEVNADVTYKCTTGTLKGTKCVINTTKEVDATKGYSCQVGKLNGTKCDITSVDVTDSVYYCEVGTLNGNKCVITTTDKKDPTYYCDSDYTIAGKKCYKTTSTSDVIESEIVYKTKTEKVYKWSTSEKLEGWTRTGKTRTTNVSITSKR